MKMHNQIQITDFKWIETHFQNLGGLTPKPLINSNNTPTTTTTNNDYKKLPKCKRQPQSHVDYRRLCISFVRAASLSGEKE